MHLNVTIPEIPVEQRVELVKNLTETVCNIVEIPVDKRGIVSIRLHLYGKNLFSRGGEMVNNGAVGHYHIDLYSAIMPVDRKRHLVQHLTNALCDTLRLSPEQRAHVMITIHQFNADNVGTGGRLLADLALV